MKPDAYIDKLTAKLIAMSDEEVLAGVNMEELLAHQRLTIEFAKRAVRAKKLGLVPAQDGRGLRIGYQRRLGSYLLYAPENLAGLILMEGSQAVGSAHTNAKGDYVVYLWDGGDQRVLDTFPDFESACERLRRVAENAHAAEQHRAARDNVESDPDVPY